MNTRGTQSTDDPGDSRPMLNTVTGTVSSQGVAVRLTRTEQAILARLMQSPSQVLSRDRVYEVLYNERPDSDCPDSKIIDVFICKLRNKLGRIGCNGVIQTVGQGVPARGSGPR